MAFHLRILFPPVKIGYRHQRSRSHWPLLLRPKALPPSASTYPSMSGYRLHTVFRDQMDAWPGSFTYSSVSSPAKSASPYPATWGWYLYPGTYIRCPSPPQSALTQCSLRYGAAAGPIPSHPAHTRPSCTMRPLLPKMAYQVCIDFQKGQHVLLIISGTK